MILLDTSALIELADETEKGIKVAEYCNREQAAISTFTINEVLITANEEEKIAFEKIFEKSIILSFNKESAYKSIEIEKELRKEGKMIGKIDIFIASIAVCQNISILTTNNDFKKIKGLKTIIVDN
ncbi:type II toxin-antitoxin system VapC family toxin [Candidatus Pacearchaeota archaeon]|nr:type II toxin-antitoxin system VapC family toxin [Candidatus Pacearchaeota archaeon]